MHTKYLLAVSIFLLSLLIPTTINAQEGHPFWWFDCKGVDIVVEGEIVYDSTRYYELNSAHVDGNDKMYYWIVGSIKIDKILFVNKNSQHIESYQLLIKEVAKGHSVLIPAYQQAIFSGDAPKPKYRLSPILGLDIPKEQTIFNLSQIYIFPILELKLESVVPRENIGEALKLLDMRPNNLIGKNPISP